MGRPHGPVRIVRSALLLAMGLGALLSWMRQPVHAAGVWTYVDDRGVTHVGNVAPPPVRRIRWLGFDERVRRLPPLREVVIPGVDAAHLGLRVLLESAAAQHALDPALVTAIAAAESGFRPDAVSPKGAVGVMQVMPATAMRYGLAAADGREAAERLKDPHVNVSIGVRYLADLLRMFDGDLELAVAAYNAGEGAVVRHGRRVPPYGETQQYVRRVLQLYARLAGHGR